MPESMHIQLERWIQIAILQRYIAADQLKFFLDTSPTGTLSEDELQNKLDRLIEKTCQRFRLIPPGKEDIKSGKPYQSWEQEMLVLFCCVNYDKMMCAVCPLSLGMDEMIKNRGAAPCILLSETKIYIFEPAGCPILASEYWDENYLIQQIAQQKNHEVAANFLGISKIFHPRPFVR